MLADDECPEASEGTEMLKIRTEAFNTRSFNRASEPESMLCWGMTVVALAPKPLERRRW